MLCGMLHTSTLPNCAFRLQNRETKVVKFRRKKASPVQNTTTIQTQFLRQPYVRRVNSLCCVEAVGCMCVCGGERTC